LNITNNFKSSSYGNHPESVFQDGSNFSYFGFPVRFLLLSLVLMFNWSSLICPCIKHAYDLLPSFFSLSFIQSASAVTLD
jgi:hypothetical protein